MVKVKLFIIVLCVIMFTTSCWSRREIEDLGFVMGMGISITDKGLYSVTVQVANPEAIMAEAPDQRNVYTILTSEGISIFDAIRNLSRIAGRRLYIAHIKVILIHESISRAGLDKVVGFLIQDMEVRLESQVFICKIPPAEILDTPNTLGTIPANALEAASDNYGANSKLFISEFHKTVEAIYNPVINYTTALIEKIPAPTEQERDLLKLTQTAVFNNTKLKGYLDEEEGQGFNFITNNFKNGLIIFKDSATEDAITIEILESQIKITPTYNNEKVGFTLELEVKGNLAERVYKEDGTKALIISQLESQLDKVLENKLNKSIAAAQHKFKIDFFNLSNQFHKAYPNEFRELKGQWNEAFSTADISVQVKSSIIHSALNTNRGIE